MDRTGLPLRHGSPVPGFRLRLHKGHWLVDVTWNERPTRKGSRPRRCSTSYPIGRSPIAAMQRALDQRRDAVGVELALPTAEVLWRKLKTRYGYAH